MNDLLNLEAEIKQLTESNFNGLALKIFKAQYHYNKIYKTYCDFLKIDPNSINSIKQIPFLPIQFFKNKIIKTTDFKEEIIFESSGTTGSTNSKHFVRSKSVYEGSYIKGFRKYYGSEKDYCIIGLLPSYLEKQNSSLVYMVDDFINRSKHKNSGFYLYNYERLKTVLEENEKANQKTILIGVTYALIDFAEQFPLKLLHTTIMETGGMKGRKAELTRSQVHKILSKNFQVEHIHSEYGMTELLSQAYSTEKGIFKCSNTLKVLVRSEDDPFEIYDKPPEKNEYVSGGINVIDLANLYSCSFIATDDAGKLNKNGNFEILGRLENSDIRGCGLMVVSP